MSVMEGEAGCKRAALHHWTQYPVSGAATCTEPFASHIIVANRTDNVGPGNELIVQVRNNLHQEHI